MTVSLAGGRLRQAPRPDFLHPQGRTPWAATAWCAIGVVTLLVAGLEAGSAWGDRAVALEALDEARASAEAAPAREPGRTPTAPRAAEAAPRGPGEQHWRALLGAIEDATGPGVRWVTLQRAADGQVRLQGTADSPQTVWAVVQRLRGQPGWQQVVLTLVGEADERGRRPFEIAADAAGAR